MANEIKPEQVPKESLVAYQRAFKNGGGPADGIAAALSAWPGAFRNDMEEAAGVRRRIILPLPTQENGDE